MGHPCTTLEEFPEHIQKMLLHADVHWRHVPLSDGKSIRYLRSHNLDIKSRLLESEEIEIKTYIEEKCPGVKVIFE